MKTKDIHAQAIEHFNEGYDADQENRRRGIEDLEFAVGDGQWPEAERTAREKAGKPCITMNRMPQFIRQVTGDIRRTNPGIKVFEGDNDANSAEIYAGLIRQIEYMSSASAVYENAAELAAQCSRGWFRVLTEYENEYSFNQVLKIKRVRDPFAVVFDPLAEEPTKADGRYVFVFDDMAKSEFEKKYPNATPVEFSKEDSAREYWATADSVRIAEYFWRADEKLTISLMPDGSVIEGKQDGAIETRETMVPKIKWAKLSGKEIIEGPQDWNGKHLPVIAVTGEEIQIGKKTVMTSVIRHAKDAQTLYNYSRSAHAELVSLQPKAPYIGTAAQLAGHEKRWQAANQSSDAVLVYNHEEGVSPPSREMPPVASPGLMQEIALAADDMNSTTGIYAAALGEESNEKSGVAIRQRQTESDISTSVYVDNLAKAIEQCGRVLVDMIPKVYDTSRAIAIIGPEENTKIEQINNGENDLTVGTYSVRISTGPSYSTQRQEAAESLIEFGRAYPQAAPVIMDLIAQNQDWPGADQIAERLRKLLPPGVAEQPEEMTPEEQQTAALQQQQAEQQAQIQQKLQEAEIRKVVSEADEAEADAKKANVEAAKLALELAMEDGSLKAQVEQLVSQAVAQTLAN